MNTDKRAFYCEVLGVSPDSTQSEIRNAYLRRAKVMHPDHNPNFAAAKTAFQLVNEAYLYLQKHKERSAPSQRPAPPAAEPHSRKRVALHIAAFLAVGIFAFAGGIRYAQSLAQPEVFAKIPPSDHSTDLIPGFDVPPPPPPPPPPGRLEDLVKEAKQNFTDGKYEKCLSMVSSITTADASFEGWESLKVACEEGLRLPLGTPHSPEAFRAPASDHPERVDFSTDDPTTIANALCTGTVQRQLQKAAYVPDLPEVKVLTPGSKVVEGVAKLSRELRRQFRNEQISHLVLAREIASFCKMRKGQFANF